jgi:monofunctional biosynthetic peptidoglycan transglycosylase
MNADQIASAVLEQRRAGRVGAARVLSGLALFAMGVILARQWFAWPDVRELAGQAPSTPAIIARAQEEAGAAVLWTPTALNNVSPQLQLAVLVAEDIEFFQHHGFSWAEIRAAVAQAQEGGRPRGASTITQQLAKNLWLTPSRSLGRKVREAALTVDLERFLTKRRILELYLNVVPFGPRVFGAEAAARKYFDRSALFLTEEQSAMLAAGLSRPSLWNPATDSPEYRERVALVRRRMANAEFLWRHLLNL